MPPRSADPLQDARYIARAEFYDRFWDYQPGEHVTILGPTGDGKTRLAFELLACTAHPRLPFIALVTKPQGGDSTVTKFARDMKVKTIRSWPPPPVTTLFERKTPGWVLWPKTSFDDLTGSEENQHYQFARCMSDSFKKRNRIIFADELFWLTKHLGMQRRTDHIHTQGRGLGVGLWVCSQRPRDIPMNAYSQAEHIFMSNDRDVEARKRYAEIGGVDRHLILHNLARLRKYELLYIKRTAPADADTNESPMCIVGK